jgi:hypothetical protein
MTDIFIILFFPKGNNFSSINESESSYPDYDYTAYPAPALPPPPTNSAYFYSPSINASFKQQLMIKQNQNQNHSNQHQQQYQNKPHQQQQLQQQQQQQNQRQQLRNAANNQHHHQIQSPVFHQLAYQQNPSSIIKLTTPATVPVQPQSTVISSRSSTKSAPGTRFHHSSQYYEDQLSGDQHQSPVTSYNLQPQVVTNKQQPTSSSAGLDTSSNSTPTGKHQHHQSKEKVKK